MTSAPSKPARGRPRIVVIHGYGASPENHWFPWLSDEMALAGIPVSVAQMPEKIPADAGEWGEAVKSAVGDVDSGTFLVGHSLGCITILRHLASLPEPWALGGLILVAGFAGKLAVLPELDPFLDDGVQLDGVAENIRHRLVIHSDNDPTVPPAASAALASRLDAGVLVVPGAKHFLDVDGIAELPPVRGALKQWLAEGRQA
jgi:predicted alpha/beta hydrolase family esterase